MSTYIASRALGTLESSAGDGDRNPRWRFGLVWSLGRARKGVAHGAERLYQPVFWPLRAQNRRFDRVGLLHPLRRDQNLRISGRRNGHIRETRRILSIVPSRSPTLASARRAFTSLEPRMTALAAQAYQTQTRSRCESENTLVETVLGTRRRFSRSRDFGPGF
jgi:hypothetical protein